MPPLVLFLANLRLAEGLGAVAMEGRRSLEFMLASDSSRECAVGSSGDLDDGARCMLLNRDPMRLRDPM